MICAREEISNWCAQSENQRNRRKNEEKLLIKTIAKLEQNCRRSKVILKSYTKKDSITFKLTKN